MIFVNFKTYDQGSGQNAVNLARICYDVEIETQVKIIPVVQVLDAEKVVDSVRSDVWIQHVDPISYGAHTGWTLPEEAVRVGVKGVFLNHSEHKFDEYDFLVKAVARCREVGLETLVFAEDMEELKKVVVLKPDYVSYEPPELVGSEETSVSEAKPEVVADAYKIAKEVNTPLIIGAGVKSTQDIITGIKLGAYGFAIASAIVKADNPKQKLKELIGGFSHQQ